MSSESLKNSWLGHALLIAIGHAAATQRDAATSSGMSCGALSRYISGQRRAGPDTMRALTMAPIWARPGDAARIMIGHLRDEMQRADMAPEAIAIYPRPTADRAGATRAALRMLADHAADPDLAALLVDLAALVCRGADTERLPAAAESHTDYGCIQLSPTDQKPKK